MPPLRWEGELPSMFSLMRGQQGPWPFGRDPFNLFARYVAGHGSQYVPSLNFHNSPKQDNLYYADGSPQNTLGTWKVQDTFKWGNLTVQSQGFGALYNMPSGGESLDGNFRIAKSYCGGTSCSVYTGFVENMYENGVIKSPTLSFYQLAPSDNVASCVNSTAALGGVDRNKYLGAIDWTPLTSDSLFAIPGSTRFMSASSTAQTAGATPWLTGTIVAFDTGAPGFIGIPHNDFVAIATLVGAQGPDSSGNYKFPCDSTMTINFHWA